MSRDSPPQVPPNPLGLGPSSPPGRTHNYNGKPSPILIPPLTKAFRQIISTCRAWAGLPPYAASLPYVRRSSDRLRFSVGRLHAIRVQYIHRHAIIKRQCTITTPGFSQSRPVLLTQQPAVQTDQHVTGAPVSNIRYYWIKFYFPVSVDIPLGLQ